jgi:hypothetical protein
MSNFADHPDLQGLDSEQLAELALYGLRYRALGGVKVDFSKPEQLDVYWTGEKLAAKAVKDARKATRTGCPLAYYKSGVAAGQLSALFNCGVIDNAMYKARFRQLLDRHKTKVS